MEINYNTKEMKEFYIKSFLIILDKKLKSRIKDTGIYWIYKVTNLMDGKVYIGKTKNIRIRAENYINSYAKGDINSALSEAMISEGIDRFVMIPLEIADNSRSASIKEKYYIDLYDSINSGYNKIMASADTHSHGRKTGSPQTIYAKISKSKNICALNPETNHIIFSTGLKLFGDYIGKKKDDIKSFAKRQTKVCGYFIYYLNPTDFFNQIKSAKLKEDKNSVYSDCNLLYGQFIEYAESIIAIVSRDITCNYSGFTVQFITQSSEDPGYKFEDPEKFIEYYNTLKTTILQK